MASRKVFLSNDDEKYQIDLFATYDNLIAIRFWNFYELDELSELIEFDKETALEFIKELKAEIKKLE